MRAFLLAAGLGTRLRPMTDTCPKALVEVAGRKMIEYPLAYLHEIGVDEIRINVHHFAEHLVNYLKRERKQDGLTINIQDESEKLLDSGGGFAKAANWLFEKDDIALYANADALFTPDFMRMCEFHFMMRNKHGSLMTMAMVQNNEVGKRYHGVTVEDDLVVDFVDKEDADCEKQLHWASLLLVEKEVLPYLEKYDRVFSIKSVWQDLVKDRKIAAYVSKEPYQDMGEVSDIAIANNRLRAGDFPTFQQMVHH